LNLSEVNALNVVVGDPPLDQASLEQICWSFVPDFDPTVDKGLSAEGYVKLCVSSFMQVREPKPALNIQDTNGAIEAMRKLGLQINPEALPTQQDYLAMGQNIQQQAQTSAFFHELNMKIISAMPSGGTRVCSKCLRPSCYGC
jgi:hypothetical protein